MAASASRSLRNRAWRLKRFPNGGRGSRGSARHPTVVDLEHYSYRSFQGLTEWRWRVFVVAFFLLLTPAVHASAGGILHAASSTLLNPTEEAPFDYDLVVIGGGSGGIACAREAAKLGAKVALLDFVKPSPQGSTWGLGGTCVNVGCIPKKLMHEAASVGDAIRERASSFGWSLNGGAADGGGGSTTEADTLRHRWSVLVEAVQNYIKSLNFRYRVDVRSAGVIYINDLGRFRDASTLGLVNSGETLRARKYVIAVGGRPRPLDIPGGELAITSDDFFSLQELPFSEEDGNEGRILVIGGSYVALECAGVLTGLGVAGGGVDVMHRSVLLRGFDQDMAVRVGKAMKEKGTRFLPRTVPTRIARRDSDGRLEVRWSSSNRKEEAEGGEGKNGSGGGVYDLVLSAVGRIADTSGLGLGAAGVDTDDQTGEIVCGSGDETTNPNIYAIGDVVKGTPELTPVAIKAGQLLAQRLFETDAPGGEKRKKKLMDYGLVATTVFTPSEYACCGLTEEEAIERYGESGDENGVDVYHTVFRPLEGSLVPFTGMGGTEEEGYIKAIAAPAEGNRVVGLHYLGPHAGEIMQGFAVAMKMGMTVEDLRGTVGIHPTSAESVVKLRTTKASGEDVSMPGC